MSGSFNFPGVPDASVPFADLAAGRRRLYFSSDGGTFAAKDNAGTVTYLGGLTVEQVLDVVGATLTDTATVDLTFNDGLDQITAAVIDDSITFAKIQDLVARSVIGRSAGTAGDPAEIVAGADDQLLTRESGTLAFRALNDTTHGSRGGSALHAAVVGGGANGFMLGTDKTKLDGVAAGATNNVAADATPATQTLGDSGVIGASTDYAREDHRHPVTALTDGTHGSRGGGTLHPDVVAGAPGTAGFQSGLNARKLQSLAVATGQSHVGTFYHVKDYGAVGDGTGTSTAGTNDTAAIQAAIDAAEAAGGGIVLFDGSVYNIDATLVVDSPGVHLMGVASYATSQTGNQSTFGTVLFWTGTGSSATTPMLRVTAPGGTFSMKGSIIENLVLQCAGNCGIGLHIKSCHSCTFRNLYIINPSGPSSAAGQGAISMECFTTASQGEAADNSKVLLETISIRCVDGTGPALTPGIFISGASDANTSNCMFSNVAIQHVNGPGIDCANSDSNRFYNVVINTNNGGTGRAVILRGSNVSAAQACRGNQFFGLSPGGSSTGTRGLLSEGTATKTHPARDNYVWSYSTENGEPLPVIENGSILHFTTTGGSTGAPFQSIGGNSQALLRTTASTTVVAAGSDLSGLAFPIQPGEAWDVEAQLVVSNSATTAAGTGIAVNAPSGAGMTAVVDGPATHSTSSAGWTRRNFLTAINTFSTGFVATTGQTSSVTLRGRVVAGTASGNVQVRANSAATSTVQAQAVLNARKIS